MAGENRGEKQNRTEEQRSEIRANPASRVPGVRISNLMKIKKRHSTGEKTKMSFCPTTKRNRDFRFDFIFPSHPFYYCARCSPPAGIRPAHRSAHRRRATDRAGVPRRSTPRREAFRPSSLKIIIRSFILLRKEIKRKRD